MSNIYPRKNGHLQIICCPFSWEVRYTPKLFSILLWIVNCVCSRQTSHQLLLQSLSKSNNKWNDFLNSSSWAVLHVWYLFREFFTAAETWRRATLWPSMWSKLMGQTSDSPSLRKNCLAGLILKNDPLGISSSFTISRACNSADVHADYLLGRQVVCVCGGGGGGGGRLLCVSVYATTSHESVICIMYILCI